MAVKKGMSFTAESLTVNQMGWLNQFRKAKSIDTLDMMADARERELHRKEKETGNSTYQDRTDLDIAYEVRTQEIQSGKFVAKNSDVSVAAEKEPVVKVAANIQATKPKAPPVFAKASKTPSTPNSAMTPEERMSQMLNAM
ncbi:hypothetical protein [Ferrimonas marina]|uniref:Uncharacterized protein n=1 Tax=Ferrimonas marina TaxID=299255 RepID=A0A1M5UCI5_9GAMM|nr:hypothetical protein [Ferrimonas marina]SHH60669.1 hypothetical protein SAMN02745129_2502 [Ferrimonas marina]